MAAVPSTVIVPASTANGWRANRSHRFPNTGFDVRMVSPGSAEEASSHESFDGVPATRGATPSPAAR